MNLVSPIPHDILERLHPNMTETLPQFSPLDSLAELVVEKAKKPCPALPIYKYGPDDQLHRGSCECRGTGTILDTDSPMFKALFEECWDCKHEIPYGEGPGEHRFWGESNCCGLGWRRRSRAEVALLLPAILEEIGLSSEFTIWNTRGAGWSAMLVEPLEQFADIFGQADNWLDALAAAILAKEIESREDNRLPATQAMLKWLKRNVE